MPMNESELRARDAMRNIGAELLEAIRQVKAGHIGSALKPSASSPPGTSTVRSFIDPDDVSTAATPRPDPEG